MRTILITTTALVALALGGTALAAQRATTTPAPKAATHMVSGKIVKFDSKTNMLTLSTTNGDESFTIGPKATIREGLQTIKVAQLAGLMGHEVEIHYTESAGRKIPESVMVSAARPSQAASPTGTSGTGRPKPATGTK